LLGRAGAREVIDAATAVVPPSTAAAAATMAAVRSIFTSMTMDINFGGPPLSFSSERGQ
jgi:hypothetical protein